MTRYQSCLLVTFVICPRDDDLTTLFQDMGLAYEHYLKEVVTTLEKDEDFRKKLEAANSSDIVVGSTHFIILMDPACDRFHGN